MPTAPHWQHRNPICKHWRQGRCTMATNCKFLHPEQLGVLRTRTKPRCWCNHVLSSRCPFGLGGGGCSFHHADEVDWMDELPPVPAGGEERLAAALEQAASDRDFGVICGAVAHCVQTGLLLLPADGIPAEAEVRELVRSLAVRCAAEWAHCVRSRACMDGGMCEFLKQLGGAARTTPGGAGQRGSGERRRTGRAGRGGRRRRGGRQQASASSSESGGDGITEECTSSGGAPDSTSSGGAPDSPPLARCSPPLVWQPDAACTETAYDSAELCQWM
eukprot:TRINITY_DN6031_c2_g1_i6.p1 TRINITY_DN6031_c2_g1~~TRINITY_DN6031_c2_g1_i6.p1  ORF type:complete len:294 (+),score=89.65 TRINITY_DN6031_c2_g1_i6:58-882(+)